MGSALSLFARSSLIALSLVCLPAALPAAAMVQPAKPDVASSGAPILVRFAGGARGTPGSRAAVWPRGHGGRGWHAGPRSGGWQSNRWRGGHQDDWGRPYYHRHYRHNPRYRPHHGGYWDGDYWPGIFLGLPLLYGGYYDSYYDPYYGTVSAHIRWCQARYRSYRAYDNSWQPKHGPRRACISPYG